MLDPAGRDVERRLVFVLRTAFVKAGEGCLKRNVPAVLLVAFDGAVGQAQSEGGVGIVAGAFDGEPRFFDQRMGLLFDLGLRLHDFAHRPRFRVYQLRQFDHRIVRDVHGGLAILVKLLPQRHVFYFRTAEQPGGAVARRFAGQDLLNQFIAVPQVPRQPGQ